MSTPRPSLPCDWRAVAIAVAACAGIAVLAWIA
jgi:hypothetical protein